jgi:hypothetical protein
MADPPQNPESLGIGKTKVFISWSGEISQKVAEELRDWLPCVLQNVDPFMSDKDISKGDHWATEISKKLEESDYGIICLTPENLNSTWLHFEAGAIAKKFGRSRLYTLLLGLPKAEIRPPLSLYQATDSSEADFRKLVEAINTACSVNALQPGVLDRVFRINWPQIEPRLRELSEKASAWRKKNETTRPAPLAPDKIQERLDDVVVTLRDMQQTLMEIRRPSPSPSYARFVTVPNSPVFYSEGGPSVSRQSGPAGPADPNGTIPPSRTEVEEVMAVFRRGEIETAILRAFLQLPRERSDPHYNDRLDQLLKLESEYVSFCRATDQAPQEPVLSMCKLAASRSEGKPKDGE